MNLLSTDIFFYHSIAKKSTVANSLTTPLYIR